jgi:hypothetical protein
MCKFYAMLCEGLVFPRILVLSGVLEPIPNTILGEVEYILKINFTFLNVASGKI